ncbi:MAG: hypothetical protein J6A74_01415, partial [Oscillospiraceae bacterium]|nr:hypothetical protein [Oscillospiraceae bacterium]
MERGKLTGNIQKFLNKYKFVILILMIGLVLMLLPTGNSRSKETAKVTQANSSTEPLSQQLETILSTIQGAGRVRVMLTIAAGEEVIYQTDNDHTTNDTSGTSRSNTVVITDSDRNESG